MLTDLTLFGNFHVVDALDDKEEKLVEELQASMAKSEYMSNKTPISLGSSISKIVGVWFLGSVYSQLDECARILSNPSCDMMSSAMSTPTSSSCSCVNCSSCPFRAARV